MLSGIQTITVTAANTFGCPQLSMYVDNVLVDTLVNVNIRTNWTFTLDTTKFSGTLATPVNHTLKIVAYDLGGNATSTSQVILIGN